MEDKILLKKLVEAVSLAHADIAPGYQEYVTVALALAYQFGEEGRQSFHDLVCYSPKYRAADADKLYTYALKKSNGKVTLGSVVYLAERAGVRIDETIKPSFPPLAGGCEARVRAYNKVETYPPTPILRKIPEESDEEGESNAEINFPLFPKHAWPGFLQQIVDCAPTDSQKDILLLSTITVMGSTLNWLICSHYGDDFTYPNLMSFIVGRPASGKSVASWARELAMPYKKEYYEQYKRQLKEYRRAKALWDKAGNKRDNMEIPEEPIPKLFIIPGDTSGTGLKEALIATNGIGLIVEAEADTMTSAISTDYGHWSDTLRIGFDNGGIAFYRRKEHESQDCDKTCFSAQLSGTYAQVGRLIPSAENGLFSRFLFYVLPPVSEWKRQVTRKNHSPKSQIAEWGKQWKKVLDAVRGVASSFELEMTDDQRDRFDIHFARILGKAELTYGDQMIATATRLGVCTCRMMCIVAFVRAIEHLLPMGNQTATDLLPKDSKNLTDKLLESPYLQLSGQCHTENILDKVSSQFTMSITEEDFEALLQMSVALYQHAGAVLSLLPNTENPEIKQNKKQSLLNQLPISFTRAEALKIGESINLSEKAVDCQLKRALKKGILKREDRGVYSFIAKIKDDFSDFAL